jgi:putative ABC transport system substrate-binding protein
MKRREFITLLGGAAAAPWPLPARAQQSTGMPRVGVLIGIPHDAEGEARATTIQLEFQKLGWTGGRNLRIDYRWAAGAAEQYVSAATELVRLQPDVIIANSAPSLRAIRQLTSTIPIVFVAVSDPVGAGLVESLARPGGNMTGFSIVDAPIIGKWLGMLKEVAPHISRVAIVFNPRTAATGQSLYADPFVAAAPSFGVKPIVGHVHTAADLEFVVASLAGDAGLIVPPDTFTVAHRRLILDLVARNSVPAVYGPRFFALEGGLLSYGPDVLDLHRRAVMYVDRILRGTRAGDLPVQAPTKFELVINLKTAKALGLTVPQTLLALADQVLE